MAEGGFFEWTGHQVGIGVALGVSMVGWPRGSKSQKVAETYAYERVRL